MADTRDRSPALDGPPPGADLEGADLPHPIPKWMAVLFTGVSLGLLPWIAVLYATLPSRVEAANWRFIWVGFDLMLVVTLGGTAVQVLRRSPRSMLVATAAGTLLVCDAWFDVLTASGTGETWVAVLIAIFLELPLAAVCYRVAFTLQSLFAQARPHLAAAGFTVQGSRLVPPTRPDWSASVAGPDPLSDPAARRPSGT